MLGDRYAASHDHEGRCRGDVQRACAVAARAANIDRASRRIDHRHGLTHGARSARDFGDRGTSHGKRGQERGHAHFAHGARHHGAERLGRFHRAQLIACRQPPQQGGEAAFLFAHARAARDAVRASLKKFCSSA